LQQAERHNVDNNIVASSALCSSTTFTDRCARRSAARRGLRASKCRVTSVQTTYCIITSSETISHFHHYHHHSSWSSSSSSSTARMSATAATSTRMCHTVT